MTTNPTLENLEIQHSAATRILHIEKRPQDIVAVVLKAKYTRVLGAAPELLKALKLVLNAWAANETLSCSQAAVIANEAIAQAEGQKK